MLSLLDHYARLGEKPDHDIAELENEYFMAVANGAVTEELREAYEGLVEHLEFSIQLKEIVRDTFGLIDDLNKTQAAVSAQSKRIIELHRGASPAEIPAEIQSIGKMGAIPITTGIGSVVYFLYSGCQLVYVGITKHLFRRISEHQECEKIFDTVYYFEVPWADAPRIESELIATFKPVLNKKP